MSNSLRPHETQHARPPCPSPTPGVYPNSCPLSRWCHPTISSSVVPFFSCPQYFPASGSFPMSQLFASGGQSFSFNISPSNGHLWRAIILPTIIFSLLAKHSCLSYIKNTFTYSKVPSKSQPFTLSTQSPKISSKSLKLESPKSHHWNYLC